MTLRPTLKNATATATAALSALALSGSLLIANAAPASAASPTAPQQPRLQPQSVRAVAAPVMIRSVQSGSPAEKAGLKAGDAILSIDGKAVAGSDDVLKAVAAKKPGATITLEVQDSSGAKRSVTATLGDNPQKAGSAYLGIELSRSGSGGKPGDDNRGPWSTLPVTQTLVMAVASGSPAEKAGIKTGDLIVAIDGKAIAAFADVSNAVQAKKPGDPITLDVKTGSAAKRAVTVTLGSVQDRAGVAYLGVRLGVPRNGAGGRGMPRMMGPVTVSDVQADSPAAKAGVLAGDVITEVNGQAVTDLRAMKAILDSAKVGDKVALKIMRGAETKSIDVTLGENPNQKGKAYIGISVSPAPMRFPLDRNSAPSGTSG